MTAYLQFALCALLGYALGNIQSGLIIGRLMNGADLREHGSGSSGATNALRVLGRRQAALTFLGDCLKGIAAAGVGLVIAGRHGGMVGGAAAVIGHIWPVFFGFRGGRGVATSSGALLLLMPVHVLVMLAVGIPVLLLTKIVSLASLAGAVTFFVMTVASGVSGGDWFLLAFGVVMAGLVIFAHRANIGRLLNGTEGKISASMPGKKRDGKVNP